MEIWFVEWEDHSFGDEERDEPVVISSVGYKLKETKKLVHLAQSYCKEWDKHDEILVIIKKNITNARKLAASPVKRKQ